MKITFDGAARTVTGSKHLLTAASGKKILLDCGFYQDKGSGDDSRNRFFSFDPKAISAVILSHAHIDHSGNLPNLVRQGFRGPIYSTSGTFDLCKVMLADSAHIQEHDANYINKKRLKRGEGSLKPIYTIKDVEHCLNRFVNVPYSQWVTIDEEVKFMFTDAGHILGSAAINLISTVKGSETRLCFTGDIGRSADLLLKPPVPFPQADYIISESTYGARLHESTAEAENKLLAVVTETCVHKKGKLLIPAFSLGRTQEIVYTLDRLKSGGKLPPVSIFVDSPLAINATEIMKAHPEAFNDEVTAFMKTHPDPFGFSNLTYVQDVQESIALNSYKGPCIIISSSGMMDAGRILHHLKNCIADQRNTLLIVGYCPPESIGKQLIDGAKAITLFNATSEVKIQVEVINSYSAHGDYKEVIQYLSCQDKSKVRTLFLVHGEMDSILPFRVHLSEAGFNNIVIPEQGESVEL